MKKRQQQATATLHINDLGGSWDSAGTFGGYASEAQEEMAAIMQTMHNLSQEVKDLKDAKEQMEKDQKEQAEKEKKEQQEKDQKDQKEQQEQQEKEKVQAEKEKVQAEKEKVQAEKEKVQAEKEKKERAAARARIVSFILKGIHFLFFLWFVYTACFTDVCARCVPIRAWATAKVNNLTSWDHCPRTANPTSFTIELLHKINSKEQMLSASTLSHKCLPGTMTNATTTCHALAAEPCEQNENSVPVFAPLKEHTTFHKWMVSTAEPTVKEIPVNKFMFKCDDLNLGDINVAKMTEETFKDTGYGYEFWCSGKVYFWIALLLISPSLIMLYTATCFWRFCYPAAPDNKGTEQ
jgi:flagellar motor protein MotB